MMKLFGKSGNWQRREVLGGVMGGAALAAGLGPIMVQAASKRGGTMRVAKAHGNTTDTLNPGTWDNGFTISLAYGYGGFLSGVATDGSLQPELAESWEASSDAKVWRFKIRDGVTFHNGKTLTTEDVIASMNFHRGPDSTSVAAPFLAAVTSLYGDGNTVVFELESGSADFPFTFTDYHLPIMPADGETIDWKSGIGCGPYRIVDFNPGVSVTLERHGNDWNSDRGFFDRIEMLSVVDLNARTTALISGDVHAIDRLDLKTVGLMARNPNLNIHSVAGTQHFTFAMHTNAAPYDDVNVRLALKHAINREELVEKILFGYGSVGNDHPIGQGQRYFNSELEQRTYDPDKAKFFLKQAGLENLTVELAAADAAFPGAVDAAVLYQSSANAAGIDLTVKRAPNDGYWSDIWLKHPFCAVYWGGRPVEDAQLTMAYTAGADWNDTNWENTRFNELLVSARAELDEDKRRDMYWEMQALINEDGGTIVPMFANYVFATAPDVMVSESFSSHWDMDGERWMERWSFA